MKLLYPNSSSFLSFSTSGRYPSNMTSRTKTTTFNTACIRSLSSSTSNESKESKERIDHSSRCCSKFCSCGRRRFIEGLAAVGATSKPSNASDLNDDDPVAVLKKIHPPRADWYEEFYAWAMDKFSKSYEAEIAGYKSQLFATLRGKAEKIAEIGIGTGPNLKYYATDNNVHVFGMDPNRKMEKYARAAAEATGLPTANFKFMQGVAEALPLSDASVDAVVGTLVLCSVKDVDLALQEVKRVLKPGGLYLFVEHVGAKDGTFLRFVQGVLNPLQQKVSDGCHLTRDTGKNISEAGFQGVDINMASLSTAMIVNPQVYGIAYK